MVESKQGPTVGNRPRVRAPGEFTVGSTMAIFRLHLRANFLSFPID
jgi:hypothetical protein